SPRVRRPARQDGVVTVRLTPGRGRGDSSLVLFDYGERRSANAWKARSEAPRPSASAEAIRRPGTGSGQRHRGPQRLLGGRAEGDGSRRRRHGRRGARRIGARQHGSLIAPGAPRDTPSVRLRRKIAVAVRPAAAAYDALVEHPRLRELWPEYLVQ